MRNATYNAFSLSFYRSDSLFLYYDVGVKRVFKNYLISYIVP